MKAHVLALFTLSLLVFSIPSRSANINFLHDDALRHYTDSDWKIIELTSDKVLNSYPNDKKAEWNNPDSKNSGYIVALNRSVQTNLLCRDLKFYNQSAFGNSQYVFKFCKYPDAGWKIPGDAK